MKISKIICFVIICLCIAVIFKINCDPNIILQLQQPNEKVIKAIQKDLEKNKAQKVEKYSKEQIAPQKINNKLIKGNLKNSIVPPLSGVMATYAGYTDYSSTEGFITFLLRHTPPTKIYLLITDPITLNKIRSNTFSTAQIASDQAVMYSYEKKKDKNEMLYWSVKKIALPKDNKISDLTLTILTKPKNIFVFEGDLPAQENANLLLPNNVYLISNDENAKMIIQFFDINRFFENIRIEEKKASDLVNQQTIINQ
ncbi:TPA: hypothetical protein DEO28_02015 [Candidatus Dependentiae bacterium]|nr:MAG: hypothetical protein UR14_C0004G0085 [candidate division TM6 bacterium GW2011_GWE2_31_21]KKP53005.1 MAG: hypothetical protein UR43_C0008G0087 [candidate division TM6 bacterium GW2011_GWF2_33_332]HBS47758.1 hypothetical protein [Candidatus Dependentiae bacterium]HBZ73266.1 hypothetical protein [Candidatus Dependentiae bacterium]